VPISKIVNPLSHKIFFILFVWTCLTLAGGIIDCKTVEASYQDGMAALKAGDYETARKILLAAAEKGDVNAQAALGELYNRGVGINRNAPEAAKWYRRAAEQGHLDAQVTLGWMYNAGTGVPQDFMEAIKWFELAAKQGHPGAQNNLGVLYRQERGGEKNVGKALMWFQKAADQGMPHAQYALGQMYLNGEGLQQNVEQAVHWYTLAANQGLMEAQADLGFLYAKRENKVPEDYLLGYQWLALSAQQGDRMAPGDLKNLMETMTPDQIKEAKKRVEAWNKKHPPKSEF